MKDESQSERDRRIKQLWETLDTRHEGHLDLKGFKQGLKRMDHRECSAPLFMTVVAVANWLVSPQKCR